MKGLRLAGSLLAAGTLALASNVQAQDLLAVWQAAAGHDQRLAMARAEHGVSQTLRSQADALWRPQVGLAVGAGLGANDTAMRGARFSAPGMGIVDKARFATSVESGLASQVAIQAQQPLVNAARDAQQAQLQLAAEMGAVAWQVARAELMLATARRYFGLAIADEQVRVIRSQAEALTHARAEASERYRLGSSPITDMHEADAALAGVRASEALAVQRADVQRDILAGSTGLDAPQARLPACALAPVVDLEGWLAAADAANPRLRMLGQAVEAAEQKLRERGAAGRPTLDLVAQAGHERIAGRGDFGSARNREVQALISVQLNVPLYTGGMQAAQEREAAGRLAAARAELELAREETRQRTHAAWLGLGSGQARIKALEEGLVASLARLDATRLGVEVGDRALLDLLNAVNDHGATRLALAQARSEQILSRLELAALADRLDESLLVEVDATLGAAQAGACARGDLQSY